jgi:transcriptional repressor NrdR
MQCPYCGSQDLKVLDTQDIRNGIRRRRECRSCSERFTTYERPLAITPLLIKNDGNREEFDREKLKRGIWNACAKRPIPAAKVDQLVARIETHLQSVGRPEVPSHIVGDMVIEGLKELDPIAYIRYAIVYLRLDSLSSVRAEIDKLLAEQSRSPQDSSGSTHASAGAERVRKSGAPPDRSGTVAEPGRVSKRSRRGHETAVTS